MKQFFFNFGNKSDFDLIKSKENELVISELGKLNHKLVYVLGSSKSGKTTLVKNFSKKHKALVINNDSELKFSQDTKIYFIDQNLSKFNSNSLFHFIQNIIIYKSYLYVFSSEDNSKVSFGTPDLDSRISSFNKLIIEEPDSSLILLLLKQHLKIKSIKLDEVIIQEIPYLIDRSYLAVFNCVEDINRLLYQNNHNINLRLIKEFYNAI